MSTPGATREQDEPPSHRSARGPRRAARGLGLAALALPLAGCAGWSEGFLAAAGPVAAAQRAHFLFIIACMAVVIVPLFVALPIVLWRYRHRAPRGSYRPDWSSQRALEFAVWLVPVAVVAVMAVVLWRETHELDPYAPVGEGPPLEVQVVALDWKFLFLYPEQRIATVNRLVVPAGHPLRFELTSGTVMQSFIVPRLGGQIYAMGGMVTELNLMADAPGRYRGQNTQYNGRGFPDQRFAVEALPPEVFRDWAARTRGQGDRLDNAAYSDLAAPSVVPPREYGGYATGLFERVVAETGAPHG